MEKNLPASAGDRFLGGEDPLEEGMATHSSVLAGRIPWTEEPGGLQSMGHRELDSTECLRPHRRRWVKENLALMYVK